MNTWFISYHDHVLIAGLVKGSFLVILNPNWGLVLVPCWLCYGDINHMVVDFDGVYIAGVRWLSPAYRLSKPLVWLLKLMMSIQSPSTLKRTYIYTVVAVDGATPKRWLVRDHDNQYMGVAPSTFPVVYQTLSFVESLAKNLWCNTSSTKFKKGSWWCWY